MGECLAKVDEAYILFVLVDPVVPASLFYQLFRHARSERFSVTPHKFVGFWGANGLKHGLN